MQTEGISGKPLLLAARGKKEVTSRRRLAHAAAVLSLLVPVSCRGISSTTAGPHPLDPLSQDEIAETVRILKQSGKLNPGSRFALIDRREPPKAAVLDFRPGSPLAREAFAVVFDRTANRTYEAVADLAARRLNSWKEVPRVQPRILAEDAALAEDLVRADPRWRRAMRRRGITDFHNVEVALWTAGYFGLPEEEGLRVGKALSYYRGRALNYYARPIEGVVALVNLNRGTVISVLDSGVTPIPQAAGEMDPRSVGRLRPAPRPLEIVQSAGAEFDLRDGEVRWQNWSFRFAVDPREGLVLYLVRYTDGGRQRPVLYRASLSEMAVPYGDPASAWYFRNPFDAGELGLGVNLVPLRRGADCPENTLFQDAVVADESGAARVIPRAVGIYERDGGLLWKWRNETRRARQLVVATSTHLGNYDYRFNWVFQQDASIALEVLLTGVMTTKAVAPEAGDHGDEFGHRVGPSLLAVHHQHFFNFRLDMDIDGAAGNCVSEMNTEAAPKGPGNPFGNAFTMKATPLRTEQEAQRQVNLASSRRWIVTNCTQNVGAPAGYALLPGENAIPYAAPDSWLRKRAGFLDAHLWVTPFDPAERYAAGDYPNQSRGGDGLPRWTRANRSLKNQDLVLWYTVGITHTPRPEEWPVMPVHQAGFRLVPFGFFARNPALDLPRP